MVVRKLALSGLSANRVRATLTVLAITLSVSLVISVTSGYASVEATAHKMLSQFMGSADVMITKSGDSKAHLPESIITELKSDPDVERATGRLEVESGLLDSKGKPVDGRPAQIIGVRRPDDSRVETMNLVAGKWFNQSEGNVAVIDQAAAKKLDLKVGDTFVLPGTDGQLKLQVVGIVHKPGILADAIQSIYLPLATLQQFVMPNQPPEINRVMADLKIDSKTDVKLDAFKERWLPKLQAIDPAIKMRQARERRNDLDKHLKGIHIMSYLGGSVAMLSATFIVFSALSMGVTERSRMLAMLRAIGAMRGQVIRLVMFEGILLAGIGAIAGIPLGLFWIKLLTLKFSDIFVDGVTVSIGGILFGGLGSVATAIVASLLPAWLAGRVSPLDAMSAQATAGKSSFPWIWALLGLMLISLDPLLMFLPWEDWLANSVNNPAMISRQIKFIGHFIVGLPGLMLGFFLLAPMFVWILERLAGPIVAKLMGLKFAVLKQQLSSGIWRAAGTCAALMVGLSILVAMETQGNTVMAGIRIPDKFPDLFIVSWLRGLNDDQINLIRQINGIKKDEVMPIALATPGINNIFALGQAVAMPEATMFFGIDPVLGMKMMGLEFRQGNAEDAAKQLQQGRHVIVTDEFYQLKHLGIGDKLPLKSKNGMVDYTIAAVVWSPGMDLITSSFDMGRQFEQRTAASLFGSIDDAKNDFGADNIRLVAANLDYFIDKDLLVKDIQQKLGVMGMAAGDIRQIKYGVQKAFHDVLLLFTSVPLAAMIVASLGVTNTIMASIRTRRWQFGVLRSIGFTRSQLLRLVISEAILIGIIGCGLGLGAGLLMAVDARELLRSSTGIAAPITIPWGVISIGLIAVIVIAVLAAAWPAISVSRQQPLKLLQAGRAAT